MSNDEIFVNLTAEAVKRKVRRIQYVIITFDDGTTASFSGPAVFETGDKNKRIIGVNFTQPRDLPSDMYFEAIGDKDAGIVGDD
jgi:hypothetical protein